MDARTVVEGDEARDPGELGGEQNMGVGVSLSPEDEIKFWKMLHNTSTNLQMVFITKLRAWVDYEIDESYAEPGNMYRSGRASAARDVLAMVEFYLKGDRRD